MGLIYFFLKDLYYSHKAYLKIFVLCFSYGENFKVKELLSSDADMLF